ncbi:hypothetical protein L1049_003302 [Liquidambar formosana]|uniref:Calmodulin-binding domain-containing protein n=1 Tax=Liquidambar formosana TaxID=63359 RepID=A0AAP0R9G2_LIQFO
MAGESISLPTTPEKTKSDGDTLRRNSMGNPNYANSGGNILPRYLRASTGSCHDFCKYGKKHESEAKEWRSMRKRIPIPSPDSQNSVESVVLAERKKAVAVRLKPPPNSKTPLPDAPAVIKLEVSSHSKKVEVYSKQGSSNAVEINLSAALATSLKPKPVAANPMLSPNSSGGSSGRRYSDGKYGKESNLSAKHATSLKPKPVAVKPMSSPNPSGGSSGKRYSDAKLASPNPSGGSSGKRYNDAKLASPNPSGGSSGKRYNDAKLASPNPSRGSSGKRYNDAKLASPNPSRGSSGKRYNDAKNGKELNSSAKRATSLKTRPVAVKPSSSPNPSGGSSGRRNGDIKIGKKTGTSKVVVKKVVVPPTASASPKPSFSRIASLNARKSRSLKIVSPLKNRNRIRKTESKQSNNDDVPEKTLYVIKTETENKTVVSAEIGSPTVGSSSSSSLLSPKFSSSPNSPSLPSHEEEDQEEPESECIGSEEDDFILENDETAKMNDEENLVGECKRRPRKAGMVRSEDIDCASVKLNFIRGKVVDLQSENNGPRRLRFRRGRVLGENPNVKGEAQRKNFRRREVDRDTNGANPGSPKVVLRHQDVQGKKDAQGLFNNVIEETASKLVETRKSKVKALVGAFETVISLQESKPSANSAS